MLALSGMLFATSCSHEELVNEPVSQEFVSATFTIGTADGIGTRAVGDGTTVDKVACAVYDAYNNEELKELRQDVAITGKTATYSVRLAKGKNYRVAFFAYNEAAAAYNVTDLKNIIVNNDQKSNVEGRDAFTAYVDVKEGETMNAFTKKVDLKRPFAQLNLGIDDIELAEAEKAGLVVKESKIVVTNVYNAFSAYDNAVAENAVEGSMTFELNDIPTDKLKVTVNGEEKLYNYLALNYLLVGDNNSEKTLTDVEFTWKSNNGDTNAESVTEFKNVPVQRNYRTNIVGKLLTSPTIFNISIDENFVYETTIGDKDYNIYKVFNAQDLQAALDAAPVGYTTTIYLGADIVGNVTDVQKPGRKVVIDGCGYKYNGSIKVHSNSNYYADAALTIKNVNFETSTASVNIIEALENGSERYSNNITVEDCSFTATGEAINTSVAVQVKATRNVTVTGCTATNMHSLIQAQSCDTGDVKVVGCTVNGKNGVAFKQVKSATVEDTTINAAAYGIRFDGNTDNYGITVKDNNVTASQPFIVRRMTGANNTIALEGTNELNTEEEYQIVITNGEDDAEYVKPTGTYTLTGTEGYTMFPEPYPVATWDEFTAALAAGEDWIKLTADISTSASYTLTKDLKLELNGKTFAINNPEAMLNIGDKNNTTKPNVTIKGGNLNCMVYGLSGNVTITNVVFGGTIAYISASQGVISTKHANLLMENCKMTNVKKSGSTKPRSLSTEGRSSGYLILRDCNFKNSNLDRPYINPLNGNTTFELTNCALYSMASNIELGASYVWSNMNITGCSGGFTFIISRASTSFTDEETAIMKNIKKNNSGDVRLDWTDVKKMYIN